MTSKFQDGDVVRLIANPQKLVLVTDTSKDRPIFSGVIIAQGETGHLYDYIGRHERGWACDAFELVTEDIAVRFKPRHKPRWRKGDLFELPHGGRFAAVNDDEGPGVALVLGGSVRFPVTEIPKALGINIYDLEPRQ